MADLILTSNTTYEAVDLINGALSGFSGLWSASTGPNSLIASNGSGNLASGNSSYAEGYQNTASGFASHAEGRENFANGDYSHVMGYKNIADGIGSFAGGSGSTADGNQTFVFGENNTSVRDNSAVVGGYENIISGTTGSSSTIFAGYKNRIGSLYGGGAGNYSSTIIGGILNYIKQGSMVSIVGGRANSITSDVANNSSIISGEENYMFGSDINQCVILGSSGSSISNSENTSIINGQDSYIRFGNAVPNAPGGSGNQIIGGSGNTFDDVLSISNQSYIRNSSILGGFGNKVILQDVLTTLDSCAIVGGALNELKGIYAGAANDNSVILGGFYNKLSGKDSVIVGGSYNEVIGDSSVAFGQYNSIAYEDCIVMGNSAFARSAHTITMGWNAIPQIDAGNSNRIAFNMQYGSGIFENSIDAGPADYAEYFEWNDGNVTDEDRVGYCVSLVGDKIEKGNSNILGIISAVPGFVSDSASLKWDSMYLKDDFGRKIEEEYSVYNINSGQTEIYIDNKNNIYKEVPNGENMTGELYEGNSDDKVFKKQVKQYKVNPTFDKNQNYIIRADRKEWVEVGLLGKLDVRTSEQILGTKISIDTNGMAINGVDYHVLEKTKDYDGNYGIVQILFK